MLYCAFVALEILRSILILFPVAMWPEQRRQNSAQSYVLETFVGLFKLDESPQ
jgi:hypothetical protein